MRIPRTIITTLAVALACLGAAAGARADTITFTGSRDVSNVPFAAPDAGRCGTPAPPNLLATLPTGTGTSNFGAFTTAESHCINVMTRVISGGQFAFDFGA